MHISGRFIIPFILFVLIDIYAFQAFRGSLRSLNPDFRRFLYYGYWILSAIAYLAATAMITGILTERQHFLMVYGRTLLMILFTVKALSIPFLLIDDIRRGTLAVIHYFSPANSYDPSRSRFLSTLSLAMGAIPFALLSYGAVRNPYRYKVRRHKVFIEDLHPDLEGFKIVQFSDVHSGSFVFKEPIAHGIDLINKENGDLIVFTGDIVNTLAEEMDGMYEIFSRVGGPGNTVYSILGNHDYGNYHQWNSKAEEQKNFEEVKNIHHKLGWDLLLNEHRVLTHKAARIGLVGVENFSALPQFPKHGDLKRAVDGMPGVDVRILLSHDPSHWDFEVIKEHKDIDLTLSGHTHGFQFGVEIPGWFRWSPSRFVYKQWAGLYQKGRQYLYVNRGFGFLGYAGRVGILPEITTLVLTGKKE
ncbi:MAG TPA: metallophosphoesterase [Saprospiraceae bacterium]|jgi:predicted MPP superfamily phosphohydrolase|nr:MAG: metallophosphoesterase [Candidatus Parvibacillus calidus]HQP75983.1 metallophosphoesterase [Saprospiraceae bacterium]HRP83488.1 metallophosphoesterase [Saprospiraceae bacterium]